MLSGGGLSNRPIVTVSNASRRFGQLQALNDVSLQLFPGQVHLLLGNNGAGKTTLIRILLGLIKPDEGGIDLFGADPWDLETGTEARKNVGVLFEANSLYHDLTAIKNLEYFAKIYKMPSDSWLDDANKLLSRVGLLDRCNEKPTNWSAGMQRKLAIVRALLHRPSLVVLDEPTAGLDVDSRLGIREVIQDAKANGVALLIASQDLAEMQRMVTHVTLLCDGVALFSGNIQDFLTSSRLKRYLGSDEAVQAYAHSIQNDGEIIRQELEANGSSILVRFREGCAATQLPPGLMETAVMLEDIYLELRSKHKNE